MKARSLSDAWKATILVWATGATLAGALYLGLSQQAPAGELVWEAFSNPPSPVSGLRRPIPPRQVVTRTRAS